MARCSDRRRLPTSRPPGHRHLRAPREYSAPRFPNGHAQLPLFGPPSAEPFRRSAREDLTLAAEHGSDRSLHELCGVRPSSTERMSATRSAALRSAERELQPDNTIVATGASTPTIARNRPRWAWGLEDAPATSAGLRFLLRRRLTVATLDQHRAGPCHQCREENHDWAEQRDDHKGGGRRGGSTKQLRAGAWPATSFCPISPRGAPGPALEGSVKPRSFTRPAELRDAHSAKRPSWAAALPTTAWRGDGCDDAAATRVGEMSTPITRWLMAVRARPSRPSPQPTSRVRLPGAGTSSRKEGRLNPQKTGSTASDRAKSIQAADSATQAVCRSLSTAAVCRGRDGRLVPAFGGRLLTMETETERVVRWIRVDGAAAALWR